MGGFTVSTHAENTEKNLRDQAQTFRPGFRDRV